MRAMKASEAVGRRFRVLPIFAKATKHPDDLALVGRIGICEYVASTGSPYPVFLGFGDEPGGFGDFWWRELALADEEAPDAGTS